MWTVQYDANELPDVATPAWTADFSPDPLVASTVEISPAGTLRVLGVNKEQIAWTQEVAIESSGFTLEAKIKLTEGATYAESTGSPAAYIDIGGPDGDWYVEIYEDKVGLYGDESLTADCAIGNDYHIYRFTSVGTTGKLYVDGVLVLEGVGTAGGATPFISYYAMVGDSYIPETPTDVSTDYLYYSTTGAYAPSSSFMKPMKFW
jgi:hypothetical protein